jgi:hypothetical protein
MGFIGQGNPKLICYLIHLEKTDPDAYLSIRRKAFDYAAANSYDPMRMTTSVSAGEIVDGLKVVFGIIKLIIKIFFSDDEKKKESRADQIAKEISKYTYAELFESVRMVDCMSPKEKAQYLLDHEV